MRSSAHVADAVADLLKIELPRRLPLMRDVWDVDATLLPDPERIEPGELPENLANSSMGETMVNVLTPREITPVEMAYVEPDTGAVVVEMRYSCRMQCLHKGQDWPTAIAANMHLTSAVRAALLEYPTLSIEPGLDTGFAVRMETLAATYGTPTRASGTGTDVWAGSLLTCDVRSEEQVSQGSSRPTLPRVLGIDLLVEKVPVDAPMPKRDPRPGPREDGAHVQ